MKESDLQKKILDWLTKQGFWTVKTVVTNKKGTPDILACSPKGQFVAFEVKVGSNTPSKLQLYVCEQIRKAGGIAEVVWDLETVIDVCQRNKLI